MSQPIKDVRHALRVRHVADTLGIGVSSVWRLSKTEPGFPKPFSLSPRVTVWSAQEIADYVEFKQSQRDTTPVAA